MPYEVKITDIDTLETYKTKIEELKELKEILESYQEKTIELEVKEFRKKWYYMINFISGFIIGGLTGALLMALVIGGNRDDI